MNYLAMTKSCLTMQLSMLSNAWVVYMSHMKEPQPMQQTYLWSDRSSSWLVAHVCATLGLSRMVRELFVMTTCLCYGGVQHRHKDLLATTNTEHA